MQNIDYDLEYENAIKKMALGGETSILFKIDTPTGAPSKLTYIQQLLVRTKAFKEWFGDWENFANKVVQDRAKETPFSQVEKTLLKSFWQNDKSKGNLSRNQIILSFYFHEYKIKDVSYTIDYDTLEPQAYWHGTKSEEFFEFKTDVRDLGRPYSYFALNKSYSEQFSQGKTLYSVFTCLKNPYIYINYKLDKGYAFLSEIFIDYGVKNNLDASQIEQFAKDNKYKYVKDYVFDNFFDDIQFWKLMSRDRKGEFKSFLQSLGYDGVMYVEEIREDADITKADEFTRAVTIFEPNQVKLADGRNTEFSALNNDIRYDKGGLIAPNGKKSNLTPEQYKLVRTPEFKKWFGDWENDPKNASQVVDENGEPLVVYHGTYAKEPFYTFDLEKADLGFHFGTKEQAKNRSTTKFFIEGFKSYVSSYFLNIKPLFEVSDIGEWEYPQRYIDMLISDNIIDEKIAKEKGFLSAYYREDNVKIREYIKSKYGDSVGFIYNNKYEGDGKSFIVLSPNQIKLADGTNTTFDSENNDIRYAEGGEVNFDKIISSSSRFKPSDTIVFDPPLLGKNGTKLVAYQWKYTIESSFNKEGEEYGKRVSDWAQAEESAETGRDLVHVFDIEMPDGSKKSVSSESVLSIMGFVDKDTKKVFGNLATASKTLAKQQMKLAILEAQQKQYDEAKREFENIKKPTIKIAKLNELPLVIQKTIEKESNRIYFSMGDVVRPQDLPYNQYILFKDLDNLDENKYKPTKNTIEDLESTWISKRLNANNIKAPYGLYDLKNRVQRQKNKVEKMLSSDNKYAEGGKTKMDRYEHLLGIQKTTPKFAEGGSVLTEHGLTNSGKRGGYFEGKSHAEGGIKAWNSTTNSPIEVEGGEVIITKKAVEDDELYEFEGEMLTNKQILSKINESGGGVKFEDGGEVNQCNCSGKMYKFGGETMEDYQIMNKINSTYNKKQGMKNHKTSYGHNLMRKMKEGGYC